MSLKALQERPSKELEDAKQEIKQLQSQMANLKSTFATGTNDQPLIAQLRCELQFATERAAQGETTLTNTILKNERIEEQLNKERQNNRELTFKLRGKEEQIRQAQVARATDQASTSRERKLQEQVNKLRSENSNLKNTAERLHKQLQVEKAENAGRLGWTQRESCDQDDDEDVHSVAETVRTLRTPYSRGSSLAMRSETPTPRAAPTFKLPTSFEKISKLKPIFAEDTEATSTEICTKQEITPTKKRKRTKQEEIEEELPELHLDDFEAPTRPRKKKRTPSAVIGDEEFHFAAICMYDEEGAPYRMPPEDMDKCDFLQERITKTKEIWEHNKGTDWMFDFTKTDYKPIVPPCVTMKVAGRRTRWRPYCVGLYACKDCVKNGRPCFTWVEKEKEGANKAWSTWEFRLLPLHEEDRTCRVVKGRREGRYWLNDGTRFQDKDVLKRDDGDDEYVD